LKLFLIPFAGGSAVSYLKWKLHFSDEITIIPLELNGRGIKSGQPFCKNFQEVVETLSNEINQYVNKDERYFIFGHSMGALLALEIYYERLKKKEGLPNALFLSGCKPPFLFEKRNVISNLPTEELKNELRIKGGTPEEVLASNVLMDYFLPMIRADFKLLEEYQFNLEYTKVHCPIVILGGTEDKIEKSELLQWQSLAHDPITLHMFKGNHFFIHSYPKEITKLIEEYLFSVIH